MSQPSVRLLDETDAPRSAALHLDVLGMEFLARFGSGFLTAYHRAWIRSPAGLALAATGPDGELEGVMLGTLAPRSHYDWMLRHAGAGLAVRMMARAVTDPALGRELVATRAGRYAKAIPRRLLRRRSAVDTADPPSVAAQGAPRVGEVTHLMVSPTTRSSGHGRALLAETERLAAAAGLDYLELVTPPDLEARGFYDHLGWRMDGELVSRSGEPFVHYRRDLRATGDDVAVQGTPT